MQAASFAARHPERQRVRRVVRMGGALAFREMEGTGRLDRGQVVVWGLERVLRATGQAVSSDRVWLANSAEGVKAGLRRLREREAEALDRIDGEMAELRARLGALRAAREDLVKVAWRNGNVVRLQEVHEAIEEARG
jgi:pimeloyl-ACP methyl ester carboxylesterase